MYCLRSPDNTEIVSIIICIAPVLYSEMVTGQGNISEIVNIVIINQLINLSQIMKEEANSQVSFNHNRKRFHQLTYPSINRRIFLPIWIKIE